MNWLDFWASRVQVDALLTLVVVTPFIAIWVVGVFIDKFQRRRGGRR